METYGVQTTYINNPNGPAIPRHRMIAKDSLTDRLYIVHLDIPRHDEGIVLMEAAVKILAKIGPEAAHVCARTRVYLDLDLPIHLKEIDMF